MFGYRGHAPIFLNNSKEYENEVYGWSVSSTGSRADADKVLQFYPSEPPVWQKSADDLYGDAFIGGAQVWPLTNELASARYNEDPFDNEVGSVRLYHFEQNAGSIVPSAFDGPLPQRFLVGPLIWGTRIPMSQADIALSNKMVTYWTNFAKVSIPCAACMRQIVRYSFLVFAFSN